MNRDDWSDDTEVLLYHAHKQMAMLSSPLQVSQGNDTSASLLATSSHVSNNHIVLG